MSRAVCSTRLRRSCVAAAVATVEALEFRRLLAVSVNVSGDTLKITGDNGNNHISVTEENDLVVVVADGNPQTLQGGAGIDKIIVKGGPGNDVINVNLEDEDGDLERVSIDGGAGNDEIDLIIGDQPAAAAAVAAPGGGGSGLGSHGEDDLEVDVTGGSGHDDITVRIALFRGELNNGGPFIAATLSGEAGDGNEEDKENGRRGLELDIDGGSGDDQIIARVLAVNFDAVIAPTVSHGRPGADGGDGDGNIDIEIDGSSGDDQITLQAVVANAFGNMVRVNNGTNGNHGRGGNEEDLEIDIDGGSGDDGIRVFVNIVNAQVRPPLATTGDPGGGNGFPNERADVDLDLDIDGGSGHDDIQVSVTTTPFGHLPPKIGTAGIRPVGQFSDVEITIDGEAGNDNIDVVITASGRPPEQESTAGVPNGGIGGGDLPLSIEIEGGSGNDDLSLRINASGANIVSAGSSNPFVRLEGESGNDDLALIVLGVMDYGDLEDAFLLHGGSGFDTCTTNVPDEAVKEISCEEHEDPI